MPHLVKGSFEVKKDGQERLFIIMGHCGIGYDAEDGSFVECPFL